MSEEEKQAIEVIKEILTFCESYTFECNELDELNIILNLIENQQKEIEELKVLVGKYDDFKNQVINKRIELDNYLYRGNIDDIGNRCRKYAIRVLDKLLESE